MFTGLVEEEGKVLEIEKHGVSGKIRLEAPYILEGSKKGDSIAVNGVCLTITEINASSFSADVMAETFRRSNLGLLSRGDFVNLERAMAADGRFGGHIVSGHIDGTGKIFKSKKEGNAVWIYIRADKKILDLIVEKGSIAIDGISLTVAKIESTYFAVSIIPHTGESTTLLKKKSGDLVNLENDVIGKYVKKLLLSSKEKTNEEEKKKESIINESYLREHGF